MSLFIIFKQKMILKPFNTLHMYNKKNFLFINKKHSHSISNNKTSKIYGNSLSNKDKILKENKDKCGIYRWISSTNNYSYIGSSINITKRLRRYYNINYLNNKIVRDNSLIYRALLKQGYKNFNLEILEYCNRNYLFNREQYYLDLLKPEYNICKTAGSMLGFKHSAKTRLNFKNRDTGTGHITYITTKENIHIKTYNSIRSAAKNLGVSHTTLIRYINKNKLFNSIYYIKTNI